MIVLLSKRLWQKRKRRANHAACKATKVARNAPMTAGKLFCNCAGASTERLMPKIRLRYGRKDGFPGLCRAKKPPEWPEKLRVQTQSGHVRGSRQNGSAQGGRALEYVDISSPADAAMGHSGRTPSGRPNGFDLGQTGPCKGNQPSRRAAPPDIFAIWTPRTCPD